MPRFEEEEILGTVEYAFDFAKRDEGAARRPVGSLRPTRRVTAARENVQRCGKSGIPEEFEWLQTDSAVAGLAEGLPRLHVNAPLRCRSSAEESSGNGQE